jgi:spermidine synthase
LSDPRLRVEPLDGRLVVRQKERETAASPGEGYDLIIVNLPYPSTLQLNRFYTLEFFEMVGKLLTEEGILVIGCPGTLTYLGDELRDLNTMAYRTLQAAFPYVRPIPGDVTLWLASPSDEILTTRLNMLVARWEERGLQTRLLAASHIRLRLHPRYLDWFWASLAPAEGDDQVRVNRDLHPVGLFYSLSYWNALFSPGLARVFAVTGRLKLWVLSLPIVGGALLFVAVARLTRRGEAAVVPLVVAATGFTGITADLLMVFAFQTLYGHVYQWIGLLIGAFMAGLSLGGLLMTRRLVRIGAGRSTLLKLELALVLYWTLLPILLSTLYATISHPLVPGSIQWILLFLNALAGLLVGSQFPLANSMWLKGDRGLRGTPGSLYACDLGGAFLGSVVVGVVLIPVLGILETCLLAAALKLGSFLLVTTLSSRS